LQQNNKLIGLDDVNCVIASIIDTTLKIIETVALSDKAKNQVVKCSLLPLHIPAIVENWEINEKIADFGMGNSATFMALIIEIGNFIDSPWFSLIQPEFLRAPEVILGSKWNVAVDYEVLDALYLGRELLCSL